jgi:quercetin dioxygenase-like cupin family protein
MIRSGQSIENPVTGEVLIFHKTSRETDGEYVLVETFLRPGATVAAAHSHPYQSESFHVLEGRVGMKVGGEKVELGPGEGVTVLPRTAPSSGTQATPRRALPARCGPPVSSSS